MAALKKAALGRPGHLATDEAVATLARDFVAGVARVDGVRGSYLRILVAHSLRELEKSGVKRVSADAGLAAVEAAHAHLYDVIRKAVHTPDIADEEGLTQDEHKRRVHERNRRTTFARTTRSTLVRAVQAGCRLATLDPVTVTKDALQTFYTPARAGPSSLTDRVARARSRLEELIRELAQEDPAAAHEAVDEVHGALMEALPRKQMTRRRKQVGEVTLHPSH